MSTEATTRGSGVDRENPWPGLAAFTEEISEFFYGREAETQELFRLVKRETLTILFGQSGLGKTSLLQAGLAPKLRAADFLPIYLRLDHGLESSALAEQVKAAIRGKIETRELDGTAPGGPEQTLWEYFHHKDAEFWTPRNQLATPVLIFDQFEELFTLGRSSDAARARGEAFIEQLGDLIENRMPAALRQRVNEGAATSEDYVFDDPCCKILLSLREDYLPDLEGLRVRIRSIMQNRMRIRRMNGAQALEVIIRAGNDLVEPGTAPWIVHFVSTAGAASEAAAPSEHLEELEVEPALLSIFCRELNNKRKRNGQRQITTGLLKESRKGILSDFYQHSVEDLPEQVRVFVEDKLLTANGFRDNYALENALLEPGVTREVIERLVTRRLLRIDDRQGGGGGQRVELTHDVLAAPIRASRDERQHRLALARAAEREQEARRKLGQARQRIAFYIAVAGLLVSAPLLMYAFYQQSQAMKGKVQATEEQKKAMASAREAKENLDLANKVLADYYALKVQLALQQSPPDTLVAQMLLRHAVDAQTFEHAGLVDLFMPPAPFAAEKSVKLERPVSRMIYNAEGTLLAALGDGGITLIDAATGTAAPWKLPDDLSKGRIREIAFEPWNPRLFVRLSDPDAGDLLVRWDYLKKMEVLPRLRLTKWPSTATPRVEGAKPAAEGGRTPAGEAAVREKETAPASLIPLPFAFDPQGKTIAAAGPEGLVGLFPLVEAGAQGNYVELSPLKTSRAPEETAGSSEDTGGTWNPTLRLGTRPASRPAPGAGSFSPITAIHYVKHGRVLITQSAAGTTSWNAATLDSARLFDKPASQQAPSGVAVSPTGERFCTLLNLQGNGKGTLWRFYSDSDNPTHLTYDTEAATISEPGSITASVYSADGRWLALGTVDKGIHVFSSESNKPVQALPLMGRTTAIAFRPDGLGLVSIAEPLKLPSDAQGEGVTLHFWKLGPRERVPIKQIRDAEVLQAVSPDGRWILGSSRRMFHVFEAATGRLTASYPMPDSGYDELTLRDDQHPIVTINSGKELQVLDAAAELKVLLKMPSPETVNFSCFSPDGRYFALCDTEEEVKLFDLTNVGAPRVISLLEPGKTRPASAPATDKSAPSWAHVGWASGPAAFSQDGKRLAVYLYDDHALREVSVEDGRFLRRIAVPPNDDLNALAYTGDGGSFVYGANDRIVCFDPALGRSIAEVRWTGYFSRISASRDNRICLVDDYATSGFFMRLESPAAMAELQSAARRMLDSHHNAIPFVPAENESAITAPDLFLARYWAGWWEVERRLREADANPEAVLAQPTLVAIHEPLRKIFEENTAKLPTGMENMRATLEMLKPLAAVPREEELRARLMFIEGRSPVERIILLIDLLNRLDARAPQRAYADVMLAAAYAERIEDVEWRGTSLEKEAQTTAAMQALRQAVDLGYADWKRLTSLLSGRDIKTDGRYVALLERIVLALPADAPDRAAAFAAAGYSYAKRVQDEDWDGQETAKKQAVDKAYSLMQQAVALGYKDWHEIHWQFDRFDYESDLHTDPRLPALLSSILEKLPAGDAERPKVMAEIAATHARRVEKTEWTAAQAAEKNAEIQKSVTLLKQAIAAGFKDWDAVSSDFSDEVQSDPAFPLELLPEKELISLVGRIYGLRTRNAYQQTVRLADAVFARGSKAFHAMYYKGAALARLDRFADATTVLKEAVPLAPDSAWKSAAYRELASAERHLGPAGLADALPDATRAVELADGSIMPSALATRARIYFEMNQDDKAVSDLDKIVENAPDDSDAWDWKGSVMLQYPRERLMDEAAAAYTRAMALTKDRGDMDDYLEQRSIAYRYGARFNEALADMRALLRNNPDNLNVIYDVGIVRAAQGYPQEAITHYTRALERWPEDQWLFARRGLARLQTGDLPGARADFAAAMRFDDSDDCELLSDYMDVICDAPVSLAVEAEAMLVKTPGAAESLARLRLKQGKMPEASAILTRLLRDQPARITFRVYVGQYDGAIDDAVRYYRQDQKTSARAMTCAIALLARAGAPETSAEKKREDIARALFYLGRFTGGNNNNAYELQHNWDFRAVADDPAFAQLVAAQKQPDDKWNRAFERARFFAQTHARLKALNPAVPAPEEIVLAFDAAFDELVQARKLGLDPSAISNHPDFASLRNDPRYAELLKPLP